MKIKRFLCLIMAMVIVFVSMPTIQVSAENYTIAQLKEKFPHGKYWNHYVKSGHGYVGKYTHIGNNCGNVATTYTSYPCTTHEGTAGVGGYDCNCYSDAIQCAGFAKMLAFVAYGDEDCSDEWKCVTDKSTVKSVVKPGDVLHYTGYDSSGDGHWVVIVSVSGSVVTVAECNYPSGTCQIKWGRQINIYELGDTIWLYQAPYKMTDCKHSYTSDSPYVCTKCNEWKASSLKSTKNLSNVQYVITSNDAKDHTGPYGDCKSVNKYSKNTVVTAVQEVVNGYGHTWYKLSNGNYIFSDYVKKYSVSYANITTGTYYLKNVATGQYMSVAQSLDKSYQGVITWEKTGEAGMKMKIFKAPTGYKMMPSMSSTRLINPNADKVTSGNSINIVNDVNDSSQWWLFEKVGNYYVIHNVQNPACVLDAPNGSHSGVCAMTYTGANSQKWVLEPVNAPTTYMVDVNGNVDYATDMGTTSGYGTFDMYINGNLVANDVTDYCEYHTQGTKYEIKDIKAVDGRCYHGVTNGSASGTVGTGIVKITLTFASAHRYDDGTITTPATCTTDGVKKYVCKFCSHSKTEIVPCRGSHEYNLSEVIHADCTQSGCEIWICKYCKDEMRKNLEPYGHDYCFVDELLPTCSTEGIRLYSCSRCNSDIYEDVAMTEHNYNISITDATCLEGAYELKECVDCGDTVKTIISEPLEHLWDEGMVTKKPTATETGIITYKCHLCNATKTETIPAVEFLPGDVNLDGKITAADARLCLRAAARLDELSGTPRYAADYNNDNQIKAADARLILRKAAKLD